VNAPLLRSATLADLDVVDSIEQVVFSMPWSRAALAAELVPHPRRFPLIAELDGEAVAYALAWIVADELHLVSIAVLPKFRRRGIADQLLLRLRQAALDAACSLMTLEVRAGNVGALALYGRHGFEMVTLRKGYYSDSGEDAVVMLCTLAEPRG
jgi:ribosomal-protein-alanine N-acetyltransferase